MNKNKLNRIIKFYGKEAQKDVAIEEMSELTKELIKERRIKYNIDSILEEIADVSVMLQQLLMIYNFTEEDVNRIAEEKIERQLKRIGNIEQEPTVDAVPVIRCKDCKHFDRNEIGRREGGMHNICSEGRGMFLKENDFCSSAERKEE